MTQQTNLRADTYVLSNEADLNIWSPDNTPDVTRWQPLTHYKMVRPSLILLVGEILHVENIKITKNATLFLSYGRGLPQISEDGLSIDITFVTGGKIFPIVSTLLQNSNHNTLQSLNFGLQAFEGKTGNIEIHVGPGPDHNPMADWLGVSELVVGNSSDISLLRARGFSDFRISNEIAHFESVYDHQVFDSRRAASQNRVKLKPKKCKPSKLHKVVDVKKIDPNPGEDSFHYGNRLLSKALYITPPNFHQRLADIAQKGQVDIISFCAGTAQIESSLIASTDQSVSLTLVDINDHLLEQAKSLMPENCTLDLSIQNVNAVELPPMSYDVAIFVSGVHHIVELEHVWSEIHKSLRPTGELWLIGEQIGPNGNMLDAETFAHANKVFSQLDEKYRHNSETGSIDVQVQNHDCSEATFEGIRSQDIETTLARHFIPAEIYKRNCFLWRMLNQTYFDNYDLSKKEDVDAIKFIAEEELKYFKSGGRASEIHAVYKPIY